LRESIQEGKINLAIPAADKKNICESPATQSDIISSPETIDAIKIHNTQPTVKCFDEVKSNPPLAK
jgi:hypothetical protein